MQKAAPLAQTDRPACSLPLIDADRAAGNANWQQGLQAMSEWIWSGHLMPQPFPNNLGKFFLQVPAIFEQQLAYSTTLIFDEPSYRNGVQVSGFLDRVHRELVIALIAQRRRCWYSMTHHAVLGWVTAKKHGLADAEYERKLLDLLDHSRSAHYDEVEHALLEFADAFCTNAKAYGDEQYLRLRRALEADNRRRHRADGAWLEQLRAARTEHARVLGGGGAPAEAESHARAAAERAGATPLSDAECARRIDAQIVELAFLCLQFVALTDVFTALNVPDEDNIPSAMQALLPDAVIERINDLNARGASGMAPLVPPPVAVPRDAIRDARVVVEPAPRTGSRIPLRPYELSLAADRDKGLTVGGVQVGVYGWGFGQHFPGSLVYALMHHPELARFEPPYSLPVLFNEDEWRNGVQTGGYVSRLLKELVIQKIYQLTRSRYGLEHHTMFLFNAYRAAYGAGQAADRTERAVVEMLVHETAPDDTFTDLERATLSWVEAIVTAPHGAWRLEPAVRRQLDEENQREVRAGMRRLDRSGGLDEGTARERLLHHQIAELAMLTGHMDGLGRALTILRLESEAPVQAVEGVVDPATLAITPRLDGNGRVVPTGYFNTRPGLLQVLAVLGIPRALTLNECLANPAVSAQATTRLAAGEREIRVTAHAAQATAEF